MLVLCVSITHAAPEQQIPQVNMENDEQQLEVQDDKVDESDANVDNEDEALINDNTAMIQYQNSYCGRLNARCSSRQGFYYVRSIHSNSGQDRRWAFYCRAVVQGITPSCRSTYYVNNAKQSLFFMCGKNQYMAGAYSYYTSYDRRWKFTCCSASSYKTKDCRLTNYVNSLDRAMSFSASTGEVITGAFSYYSDYSK